MTSTIIIIPVDHLDESLPLPVHSQPVHFDLLQLVLLPLSDDVAVPAVAAPDRTQSVAVEYQRQEM